MGIISNNAPPPSVDYLTGIDCNHWQGSIDWVKVAANNPQISFAYLKATEGTGFIDHVFFSNAATAKNAGLKIGYYHFCGLHDASDEADFFISQVQKVAAPDLPLVLDFETNKSGLTPSECLTWLSDFINTLHDAGFDDVAIYSYQWFLDANLPLNHGLQTNKLWLAAYNNHPKVPHGWTNYWLWQYTNTGKVSGVNTNVDMNTSFAAL